MVLDRRGSLSALHTTRPSAARTGSPGIDGANEVSERGPVTEGRGRPWLLIAVAAGAGLGMFSVLADGVVPIRMVVTLGNIIAPWAIVAFAVGRTVGSARRGALAGGSALLVGVVTYYVVQAVRFAAISPQSSPEPTSAYLANPAVLIWLVAAASVGPIMGLAGAVSRRDRSPIAAVVALPALLVAEAGFLIVDRRPWLWNLSRETYRLGDLAIMVGLVAVAVALPAMLIDEPHRRGVAHAAVAAVGLIGALGIIGLYRLIVTLA
jgi:hypothetical protein